MQQTSCGMQVVKSDLINLVCGVGNLNIFWSVCGQHEIQYTEWRI